ncbi:MAG: hypothetical protein M1831_006800 [Alyxoria varia]|nr:MAG: hypothetical protein M1831_006800 [Alyxoria varia]
MTLPLTGSITSGVLRTVLIAFAALILLIWVAKSVHYRRNSITYRSQFIPPNSPAYQCPHIDGGEDVLVVVKTNVIDAHDKLPAQLATALRCVPKFVIFSDIDDEVNGTRIYNALDTLNSEILDKSPDFEIYRRLQQFQQQGRNTSELGIDLKDEIKEVAALDKWKMLPMLEKARDFHPFATWFVFVEDETTFFWTNILLWFLGFDANLAHYLGEKRTSNDLVYANGGSGFILSSLALANAIRETKKDPNKMEELVKNEDSGDQVLGRLMKQINIRLSDVWPTLQFETPQAINYNTPTWCTPVATYRADSPSAMIDLWEFEQGHIRYYGLKEPIRHSDVYDIFAAPTIGLEREDWDNLSMDKNITSGTKELENGSEAQKAHETKLGCRVACSEADGCLQFAYRKGECRLGHTLTVGHSLEKDAPGNYRSGWMLKNIAEAIEFADQCDRSWKYGGT